MPITSIVITNGSLMNLKQLEIFLAVAENGSFSKGAEATFLTQSTVSQHIAALEKEFDLKLLDRTGRGALLTEGGKLLADHTRRLLTAARALDRTMRRFRGMEDALLTIGGSNIPGDYLIPAALPRLRECVPGVTVVLGQGDSREILEKLEREEVEIAVVGSRFEREGVEFSPLGGDELRLVVGKSHRWRGIGPIAIAELTDEPMVLRESGSGSGVALASALREAGCDPDRLTVRARLGSNQAVKQAVMSGLGVAFVSAISVRQEVERGDLFPVAVSGLKVTRRFFLAARAGRELSPAARAFAALMRELYG